MADIQDLIDNLKKGLRGFIVEQAANIDFTHPQYRVDKIDEGQYQIVISLSGLGEQHFDILLLGDEFIIKGEMRIVGTNAAFPFALISGLINGAIQRWITQKMEDIARTKAKLAKGGKVKGVREIPQLAHLTPIETLQPELAPTVPFTPVTPIPPVAELNKTTPPQANTAIKS